MNLKQWKANDEKKARLATLLSDPVMQEALSLVKDEMIPQARPFDDPAHVVTLMALDQSRAAGWHASLRFLSSLPFLASEPAGAAPAMPWNHLSEKPKPKKATKQ